ncbi:MAG: tRNA threonylcarbamoyladenosine biosynthesis protein TsaE [Candidatus Marivariicella framensis]|jgi:tRNA threonylcarbamoyladenosine biosynthesis protein TsaE|tara:strand:+ start:518 stop:925 length:408 start_codon:yes stop_codon:yes gene_type:complete
MEISYSLSEIDIIAKKICDSLRYPVVAFNGPMGAGKTTLIKSICKYLNFKENISSPTFSLVNTYVNSSNKIIHHFDFYRIESFEEALDFGVDEYLDSGNMCFMEWSEKISSLLNYPINRIEIKVIDNDKRKINLY